MGRYRYGLENEIMNGKLLLDLAWSKSIEVYHPDVCHILRMSANPVLLASGLGLADGLLWHKGGYLILSDVLKNEIIKYTKIQGVETILDQSGLTDSFSSYHSEQIGSNGIAYDQDGNFVFCQQGNHAIARLHKDGTVEKLIDSFEGKKLNSPMDLTVGLDGSIYFTDPPNGLKDKKKQQDVAQPVSGVYRWFEGNLELLSSEFAYPSGICFSPDHRFLYVASNDSEQKEIYRYTLEAGALIDGKVFIHEQAKGIRTDKRGNLFLATDAGVKIFSSEGIKLGLVKTTAIVTSVCIEGNTLYMATPHKLFKFALRSK